MSDDRALLPFDGDGRLIRRQRGTKQLLDSDEGPHS